MTIVAVRRSASEGGETAPAGSEWLLFEFDVLNTSAEAFTLHVRLRDRKLEDQARAYPPGAETAFDQPIGPGERVTGEIAFLTPVRMPNGVLLYGPGDERWALQLGYVTIPE